MIVARESLSRSAFVPSHCGLDTAAGVQVPGVNEHGGAKARKTCRARRCWSSSRNCLPYLVGIEACGSAPCWTRDLAKLGHTQGLMATQSAAAYRKRGKNDPNDQSVQAAGNASE